MITLYGGRPTVITLRTRLNVANELEKIMPQDQAWALSYELASMFHDDLRKEALTARRTAYKEFTAGQVTPESAEKVIASTSVLLDKLFAQELAEHSYLAQSR